MRRLFGTNGIRGMVGSTMTPQLAVGIGAAFGTFIGSGESIALGRDTRPSGEMLAHAFASGALGAGCHVIDVGVVPTPALQYFVRTHPEIEGGVIITASHNPPEFNGIKCVDGVGRELIAAEEERVEEIYFSNRWHFASWKECGRYGVRSTLCEEYVDSVLAHFERESIAGAAPSAVLDCASGATCFTSPKGIARLGCALTTINDQPDGTFPGRMPEPTEEHLRPLIELCRRVRPDIAVAHDGDGDRTVFVDDKARYVSGDDALALLARDAVSSRGGGKVVVPVDTSLVVEDAVSAAGGSVDYTPIGSPIITRRMEEIGAVLGGEGNGGMIFPTHQPCRDGLMCAASMIRLLAISQTPLSEMVDALPKFALRRARLRCPEDLKGKIMERLDAVLGDRVMVRVDGLKMIDEEGWALIRPSGTEPIMRIVVETRSPQLADARMKEYRDIVSGAIEASALSR
ncbi:MAG: phosphoglucosamine mutase [Candidatus Thermoplasmatota archaeon]